ncbi:hypothetical protein [Methylobacterium platani]|uniref:PilZ domain-containing protein n=2 Tax=Methylobacterium platani TaxID=427683 RepID=A0A179SED1_9HYPH|nr:hypothetical protein [Methylobacterium platani]KMO16018.1 hypothetical protein SQ03_15730 [Methylobacterium platani JCM 14648]OAS24846.1 hypothetical protein A5481_12180 [Methylobacterium platani]
MRLVEVSSHGARVAEVPPLASGKAVEFEMGGSRLHAVVAWSEGGGAGLRVPSGLRHLDLNEETARAA